MSFYIPDILESFLGTPKKHNDNTGQMAFDCPVCSEEKGMPDGDGKGNLEVNYEEGVYRCWSCSETHGTHGSLGNLIFQHGSKKNQQDYLSVKPDYDYKRVTNEGDDEKLVPTKIVRLPESYVKLSDARPYQPYYKDAMRYLKDRGITDWMIDYYDIGFTSSGKYHSRIIIPSYGLSGNVDYYIARSFNKKVFPKYLNPDAEKNEVIFNGFRINLDCTIYLVEGTFDHIVIPNSIPLLGKYITEELFLFLQKARADIVILLDADAIADAKKNYRKLNVGILRGRVKISVPPEGEDPSSIFMKGGSNGIKKFINQSIRLKEGTI